MGKSSPSCFKILGCGTHSVENEHLQATETERKSSSDRRGWSFRKRSARHRVLSNSVSSELTVSDNKENPESKSVDIEAEAGLDVPVKNPPVIQPTEEKPILPPTQPETKLSADIIVANEVIRRKDDVILNEAGIIMIQTAIRGLLAQKMLWKSKNVIKLQAAVRGHLVRNHAVCTLRCIQSIIRIQKRVRARFLMNDSCDLNKMEHQGKPIYVSIEKLLSNAFANQLMDSMPRTKAMYIKCEPLKSEDSSWKWFERWMSVSVVNIEEKHETSSAPMDAKTPELLDVIRDDDTPAPGSPPEFAKLKPEWPDSGEASDDDEDESNQIVYNANDLNRHPEKQDSTDNERTKSLSAEEESRIETLETEKKFLANEQQGAEVKKFIRKGSNPVFVAVQSKFEDLSLAAPVVLKSSSFSSYESGLKSSFDKYSSATDQSIRSRDDAAFADGVIISAAASGIRIGGSECGTELSISSTLDSPDGSEAEITELQLETKAASYPGNGWSSTENGNRIQEFEQGENPNSSIIWEPPKPINTPELGNETEPHLVMVSDTSQQQVNKSSPSSSSSPEDSPKSQNGATPASETPSSNKARKRKSETGESHKNEKSQNQDYSNEQQRSGGRRRNSFGSGKLDQQEPRDSHHSISNFLPSYMQATESARAKVIIISSSNGSARSSPDVIENAKKRHSLPGSNERQESPRIIQRSLSQAPQQNGTGNGTTQSPQAAERKWRR